MMFVAAGQRRARVPKITKSQQKLARGYKNTKLNGKLYLPALNPLVFIRYKVSHRLTKTTLVCLRLGLIVQNMRTLLAELDPDTLSKWTTGKAQVRNLSTRSWPDVKTEIDTFLEA